MSENRADGKQDEEKPPGPEGGAPQEESKEATGGGADARDIKLGSYAAEVPKKK